MAVTKRQKAANTEYPVQQDGTNNTSPSKLAERGRDSNSRFTPHRPVDSYRPSYSSNQRLFTTDGDVLPPKSTPETRSPQNAPRGPKKPEVPDTTRPQQASGAKTPQWGGRRGHNQAYAGNHSWSQTAYQNDTPGPDSHAQDTQPVPGYRGRTPSHSQPSRANQAPGARTPVHCQANHSNQAPGPRNAGYSRGGHPTQVSRAGTPASSQGNRLNQSSGGRTPARVDDEPSGSWGNQNAHPDRRQTITQIKKETNDPPKPYPRRGATGGTHYRFDEEEDDRVFVSP